MNYEIIARFLSLLLFLILIRIFFGKGSADMIDIFQIIAGILVFLLPSVLIAKMGVKRWKSAKIDTKGQALLKGTFNSFRNS